MYIGPSVTQRLRSTSCAETGVVGRRRAAAKIQPNNVRRGRMRDLGTGCPELWGAALQPENATCSDVRSASGNPDDAAAGQNPGPQLPPGLLTDIPTVR